ncbi:Protein GltF [Pseudomonas fluorescens]|jgi:type 1 fimbria pilin|nr:Protein GltF [Pseudomonas fluorescens]
MNLFFTRAALVLLFTPAVFAASNTDLSVRGSITPSACIPLMSGGGVVDFGKMSAKSLNAQEYTSLPNQNMQLSVRCEGPTFFTLNTIDNRAGSSANHDHWHGLGMTPNDEKLGGSGFHLYSPVADGIAARIINSSDGGVTWVLANQLNPTWLTTVAIGSELVPAAVRDFDAEIRLNTHVAPAERLTLLDEVPIDGHATVQLKYL